MKFLLVLLISLSVYAENVSIIGTWELKTKMKSRPFTFGGLVSYEILLNFTENGFLELVKKEKK